LLAKEKIYLQPKSIDEALEFASQNHDSFKYIAGGTDVIVSHFQGNDVSNCLIDLTGILELNDVKPKGEYLHIGSMVKLSELKKFTSIKREFPVLIEAADSVGSPLIRNTATIGGNILCENRCTYYNQSEWWRESIGFCLKCEGDICIVTGTGKACYSEFISDTAPALISLNAKIEVVDFDGKKIINLEDIYTGDGVNPVNLNKTAIIKSITLPLNQGFTSVFKKLRQRESLEFTSLTTAVTLNKNNKLKIAISGVDPKPVVVESDIESNKDDLIKKILNKSRSVENDMLSRKYRKEMIKLFLNKSFETLSIKVI
jgi:4-hydroxybenzoyl-CoA reductase subunit beta